MCSGSVWNTSRSSISFAGFDNNCYGRSDNMSRRMLTA